MIHARDDYDRIQDPAGLIPDDEPVFLIRGKDKAGPATLRAWASFAEDLGALPDIIAKARAQAGRMEEWQADHGGKVPDIPA